MLVTLFVAGCPGNHDGGTDLAAAPDLAAGEDMAEACPLVPLVCPSPQPTWDGGVAEIVASVCAQCHRPGGVAFDRDFTNWAGVYRWRGTVLNQAYACAMPPPDAGVSFTEPQREALIGWLECGALDN